MKSIKGKKYLYFISLFLIVALTGCTSSPDFELYEGKSIRIAVVGEPPEVQEEQVRFTEISFVEMTGEKLKSFLKLLKTNMQMFI
jgi:hypothetical protein